jgi:predicted outer membrane protein
MDATARATLAKIKAASKGAAFDKAYITAQLANHEFLRDLAESYLKNSAGRTSMAEMQGAALASLALSTFKEHVVYCKNIS